MTDLLVEARHLTKRFGTLTAVDDVDFEVRPGEAFGFLGPNGAGKSSTMRMIAAVSPVTSGHLRVMGLDPAAQGPEIRGRIGVVPQEENLDEELSVYENLLIYGRYFGLPKKVIDERVAELLRVDVEGWIAELPTLRKHLERFGTRLPQGIKAELAALEKRLRVAAVGAGR